MAICKYGCAGGRDIELFKSVVSSKPDLYLWIGDNIYADTIDMDKCGKMQRYGSNILHTPTYLPDGRGNVCCSQRLQAAQRRPGIPAGSERQDPRYDHVGCMYTVHRRSNRNMQCSGVFCFVFLFLSSAPFRVSTAFTKCVTPLLGPRFWRQQHREAVPEEGTEQAAVPRLLRRAR